MKQETNQQASRPEHEPLVRERSNPIPKGELCRLVSDGDIEAIRALQKIATPTALKSELFSRDYHRTPLALALKHGDKQLISLLLSLGKESLIFKKYTVWIVKKSKSNLAGCLWCSASIQFFCYQVLANLYLYMDRDRKVSYAHYHSAEGCQLHRILQMLAPN